MDGKRIPKGVETKRGEVEDFVNQLLSGHEYFRSCLRRLGMRQRPVFVGAI